MLIGEDRFAEVCLGAYIADEYNATSFITVNVALYGLFLEYAYIVPGKREEYLGYARQCGINAETALSNLPLHLPASSDVLVALCFGVKLKLARGKTYLARWYFLLTASPDFLRPRALKTVPRVDSDSKGLRT